MHSAKIISKYIDAETKTFALAEKILKEVKSEVVSSNDIIDRAKLVQFFDDKIDEYIAQYGEERVAKYLKAHFNLGVLRNSSDSMMKWLEASGKPSPLSTVTIANALCGYGECGENSNYAMIKLLLAGCKEEINIISIIGAENKSSLDTAKRFTHGFIIIGNNLPVLNSIEQIAALPDNFILLDCFLNKIGLAKDINAIIGDYIKAYQLNVITNVTVINPNLAAAGKVIFASAENIKKILMHKLTQAQASVEGKSAKELVNVIIGQRLGDASFFSAKNQQATATTSTSQVNTKPGKR